MYQAFEAMKKIEAPKDSKEGHQDNFDRLDDIAK